MTTFIPLIVLGLLGQPEPAEVRTVIHAAENVICWQAQGKEVCYDYADEGTHLAIVLN